MDDLATVTFGEEILITVPQLYLSNASRVLSFTSVISLDE